MKRNILAIETSCDETSASIITDGKIISNVVSSQMAHKQFGGVVPELASREHIKKILPIVEKSIYDAKINIDDLSAIGFTQGPGLLGPLLVGCSFAKGLSYSLNVPLLAVNHLKAHIFANFIDDPKPQYPFICLIASGGNTLLAIVYNYCNIEIIGQTQDDAVGEAFDKIAKMLNIEYPGGPILDKYSQRGNDQKFNFPDTKMPNLDFSFSGIKTAFMYFIKEGLKKNENFIKNNTPDIAASIQKKLIDMVMSKLYIAIKKTKIKNIAISGGVAANSCLRKEITKLGLKENLNIFIPKLEYCTDNAAMIAKCADIQYLNNEFTNLSVNPKPRFPL